MHCLNTVLIASVLGGMLNGITYGKYMDKHGVHRRNADVKSMEYFIRMAMNPDPDCLHDPACGLIDLEANGRKKRLNTQPNLHLNTATLLDPNEQ